MAHMRNEPTISVLLAPRSEPTKLILMSGYSLKEGFSFFPGAISRSGKGGQATRQSSKSSIKYQDSEQQFLAVICAYCSSSLLPVW